MLFCTYVSSHNRHLRCLPNLRYLFNPIRLPCLLRYFVHRLSVTLTSLFYMSVTDFSSRDRIFNSTSPDIMTTPLTFVLSPTSIFGQTLTTNRTITCNPLQTPKVAHRRSAVIHNSVSQPGENSDEEHGPKFKFDPESDKVCRLQ